MRVCTDCKYCTKEYVLPCTGASGRDYNYVCKVSHKTVFAFGVCGGFKAREAETK